MGEGPEHLPRAPCRSTHLRERASERGRETEWADAAAESDTAELESQEVRPTNFLVLPDLSDSSLNHLKLPSVCGLEIL